MVNTRILWSMEGCCQATNAQCKQFNYIQFFVSWQRVDFAVWMKPWLCGIVVHSAFNAWNLHLYAPFVPINCHLPYFKIMYRLKWIHSFWGLKIWWMVFRVLLTASTYVVRCKYWYRMGNTNGKLINLINDLALKQHLEVWRNYCLMSDYVQSQHALHITVGWCN